MWNSIHSLFCRAALAVTVSSTACAIGCHAWGADLYIHSEGFRACRLTAITSPEVLSGARTTAARHLTHLSGPEVPRAQHMRTRPLLLDRRRNMNVCDSNPGS